MGIVVAYLVLSVPFSIVCIVRSHAVVPRLLLIIFDTVRRILLSEIKYILCRYKINPNMFLITLKVIIALATGAAGSSAAIVYLAHNGNQDANWLAICQQFGDFCQRASGAVVAAFVTVVLLILMVVISASALRRH